MIRDCHWPWCGRTRWSLPWLQQAVMGAATSAKPPFSFYSYYFYEELKMVPWRYPHPDLGPRECEGQQGCDRVSEGEAGRVSATAEDQEDSVWGVEQGRKGEVSKATAETEGRAIRFPFSHLKSQAGFPSSFTMISGPWVGQGADTDPWRAGHSQSLGLCALSSCVYWPQINRHPPSKLDSGLLPSITINEYIYVFQATRCVVTSYS